MHFTRRLLLWIMTATWLSRGSSFLLPTSSLTTSTGSKPAPKYRWIGSWISPNDQEHPDDGTGDHLPPTPCTRICRYNKDFYNGQVCIGCFREALEIQDWQSYQAKEKVYALQDAADRWSPEFDGSITSSELLRQAALGETVKPEF